MARTDFLHCLTIEISPEIGIITHITKPATIVTVGGSGHQRRKIAPLGTLMQLVIKPTVIHTGQLRIGQLPITHNDRDLLATVFSEMWPVA